jgi:hypothetical protein
MQVNGRGSPSNGVRGRPLHLALPNASITGTVGVEKVGGGPVADGAEAGSKRDHGPDVVWRPRHYDDLDWQQAVDTASWQTRLGPQGTVVGFYKQLACPRCTHEIVIHQLVGYSEAFISDRTITAACDCKETHEGRPEGDEGCGYRTEIREAEAA